MTQRLARAADALVLSYAQILFSGSRPVGAILLCATLLEPRVGLSGVLACLAASAIASGLGLPAEAIAVGGYGYNGLLVGLALGALVEPSKGALALLLLTVAAVALFQAAFESALRHPFNLPSLTLPFLAAVFPALAVLPHLGGVHAATGGALHALPAGYLAGYLCSLGALFFSPSLVAGALVFAALAWSSRISLLLSALGYGAARAALACLAPSAAISPLTVGYNGIVTAVALGGIWLVPQPSAFLYAALAVLAGTLISVGATSALRPFGVPVLILPFNLVLLVALQALRRRTHNLSPRAVELPAASPEENLHQYRSWLTRFGELPIRLRLPYSGRWTVTQGNDGAHTHRGAWRHALDFEVEDRDKKRHAGAGTSLTDYHCYRLPVLAAAAGTVVKVVSTVPDNPIGERNGEDPWGNLVLVQHAPNLYTLVCHLCPGTVEVSPGQFVLPGARLALCGNSGRSFVPHLHFQLQGEPTLGAPTLPLELTDVVLGDEAEHRATLLRAALPAEGESLRNLERREEGAALFAIPIGTRLLYSVTDGDSKERRETVVARIDLWNRLYLETEGAPNRLYYEAQGAQLIFYDYQGSSRSLLRLIHCAAPRVPFETASHLRWDDVLAPRYFQSRAASWLFDLAEPFLADRGRRLRYSLVREGEAIEVRGKNEPGAASVETLARFIPGTGLVEISVAAEGTRRCARLVEIRP